MSQDPAIVAAQINFLAAKLNAEVAGMVHGGSNYTDRSYDSVVATHKAAVDALLATPTGRPQITSDADGEELITIRRADAYWLSCNKYDAGMVLEAKERVRAALNGWKAKSRWEITS